MPLKTAGTWVGTYMTTSAVGHAAGHALGLGAIDSTTVGLVAAVLSFAGAITVALIQNKRRPPAQLEADAIVEAYRRGQQDAREEIEESEEPHE